MAENINVYRFFNGKTGIKEIYFEIHSVVERGWNENGF